MPWEARNGASSYKREHLSSHDAGRGAAGARVPATVHRCSLRPGVCRMWPVFPAGHLALQPVGVCGPAAAFLHTRTCTHSSVEKQRGIGNIKSEELGLSQALSATFLAFLSLSLLLGQIGTIAKSPSQRCRVHQMSWTL